MKPLRIVEAIARGDGKAAEDLVRDHITQAADLMIARLRGGAQQSAGRSDPHPASRDGAAERADDGAVRSQVPQNVR
jgi:hypothetical protein